jgi:hypothetical protein
MQDVLVILGARPSTNPYGTETRQVIVSPGSHDGDQLDRTRALVREMNEELGDYDVSLAIEPDTDAMIAVMAEVTGRVMTRDEVEALQENRFFREARDAHQQYIRLRHAEDIALSRVIRERRWDDNPRSIRETMRRQRRGKR